MKFKTEIQERREKVEAHTDKIVQYLADEGFTIKELHDLLNNFAAEVDNIERELSKQIKINQLDSANRQ